MIIRKIESKQEKCKKRVAAYARVSTEADEQLGSLQTQVEYYTSFIQRNPMWEYVGVYADPGRSGTSAKHRPEFQKMTADAKAGELDIILVKSISRFARNVTDAQRYVHELKAHEVEVRFEREAISSFDPSSDMLFSILAAIAQEESRSISENVKWSYRKHAEKGIRRLGNNRVLGYDTDKSGKLVPNEDAWIVEFIFSRYADGTSVGQIIRELSAKGAKRARSDKPFTTSSIYAILANELYMGDRLIQKAAPHNYLTKRPDITEPYNSYYITDDHEAIVDRETWERSKNRREQVKGSRLDGIFRSENTHFLYGMVFCGECGALYKRRTVCSRSGQSYKAWECGDRLLGAKGNGCKNQIIKEESLLRQISEQLEIAWNGVETFDVDSGALLASVQRIEVTDSGIRIQKREIV